MSEQQAESQPRTTLQAIAAAYEELEGLYATHDSLSHEKILLERQNGILERENEGLRQQIKRANAQRDHLMRAYTALSSYLDGIRGQIGGAMSAITDSIERALEMSRTHAYGERQAEPQRARQPMSPPDDGRPIPTFLTRAPTDGAPRKRENGATPIDLDALREAIQPR
jgi:hypothetical protein